MPEKHSPIKISISDQNIFATSGSNERRNPATEQDLPILICKKVDQEIHQHQQKYGTSKNVITIPGSFGQTPTDKFWSQELSLDTIKRFQYKIYHALLEQINIGNCWLLAPLKAMMDSFCSLDFVTHTLVYDKWGRPTYSNPSQDKDKRILVSDSGKPLAQFQSEGVRHLVHGISEMYHAILQPYKAADKQRSDNDTGLHERVLKGDISATTSAHYEAEPFYKMFKYLTKDFVYILRPISTLRLNFVLNQAYNFDGEVLGVISFSHPFTTESVQLNDSELSHTQPFKVIKKHAYYLKSFHNGIVTILNPHHKSEQIHISIDQVQKYFMRIFLAKIPTVLNQVRDLHISSTLPIYINSEPSPQNNFQVENIAKMIPFQKDTLTIEPSLYPYLPGYKIESDDSEYFIFQHQGVIKVYNTSTRELLDSTLTTSASFMNNNFEFINSQSVCLSQEHWPSLLSFYKGYLGVETTDMLTIQAPQMYNIYENRSRVIEFDQMKPFSVQVLSKPYGCELTFVETSQQVLIYTAFQVYKTTKDCFQFFYCTDTRSIEMQAQPSHFFQDRSGVYITYFFGEINVSTYGNAEAILTV